MKTWARLGAIVGDMGRKQPTDASPHENLRHPLHAAAQEAAHLREIADEGDSPATFPIIAGVVLAVVIPLAALVIFLAFAISHWA